MSFQGEIEARCTACRQVFETPVWSFVHGSDENLRNQIKAHECNLLLCPHCGAAFIPDASWIYFEPASEILAFVFPESWQAEEAKWREKMKSDFAEMRGALGEKLPIDYEPEIFFGQAGLGDLLEAADWRVDERDVMEHYARELGLKLYKASPRWARLNGAPTDYPYKGNGAPTRAGLIEGLKVLVAANDALTAWSDFLAKFEKDAAAGVPPAAKAR